MDVMLSTLKYLLHLLLTRPIEHLGLSLRPGQPIACMFATLEFVVESRTINGITEIDGEHGERASLKLDVHNTGH